MEKGADTRDAVVAEALRQTARRGLAGLSFGTLADRLGLSKSGLFAHFKSKEALQLAVLDEAGSRFRARVVDPVPRRGDASDRLAALFARYVDWMRDGCVYSTIAQEVEVLPESVADAFRDGQRRWQQTITALAHEAVGPQRAPEVVLQFIGFALAYQQSVKVFADAGARQRVLSAFERSLEAKA